MFKIAGKSFSLSVLDALADRDPQRCARPYFLKNRRNWKSRPLKPGRYGEIQSVDCLANPKIFYRQPGMPVLSWLQFRQHAYAVLFKNSKALSCLVGPWTPGREIQEIPPVDFSFFGPTDFVQLSCQMKL